MFPAIAFLVVAALNFTTGSVWGITAVTVPILLPLAFSIGANPLLVMGAIVSGATLAATPASTPTHGAHLQLLQDGEYGPRPVPTALFPVCGRAFGGGLSGMRPPDVV